MSSISKRHHDRIICIRQTTSFTDHRKITETTVNIYIYAPKPHGTFSTMLTYQVLTERAPSCNPLKTSVCAQQYTILDAVKLKNKMA